MSCNFKYIRNSLLGLAALLCLSACPASDDSSDAPQAASVPQSDPAVKQSQSDSPDPAAAETNPCAPIEEDPTSSDNPCESAANPCDEAADPDSGLQTAKGEASKLFKANNCIMCHKEDMSGTGLGPALKNIASEWDEAELKKYIKDPASFVDTAGRLTGDKKYTMAMPMFVGSDADLDTLVKWLLTK